MNKMHTLTKIVLTCIGVYLGAYLFRQLLMFVLTTFVFPQGGSRSSTIYIVITIVTFITLALLLYLLIVKRDKIAEKIVGDQLITEPNLQIQWVPFTFRLTAISAGFIGLYKVILTLIFVARPLTIIRAVKDGANQMVLSRPDQFYYAINQIVALLILIPLVIYLLYGAPHFVNWHVKKTLEQAKPQQ